nr:uncharacterized protein LOC120968772 [Aegilops tauschii subsp. strangulata]
MGFVGEQFTWRRRRLRERLDKAVCNRAFLGLFPAVVVTNAAHTKSDHQPVVIDLEGAAGMDQQTCSRPKQFKARWLQEEEMLQRVTKAWERTCMSDCLARRTTVVHQDLHKWDQEVLKAPQHRLKELKEELESSRSGPLTDESTDR